MEVIRISWEAVTALIAGWGLISAGGALFVRMSIKNALTEFENDLIDRLNGRYISKEVFKQYSENQRNWVRRIDSDVSRLKK